MSFAGLFRKDGSQQDWLWNKPLKQILCSHCLYSQTPATEHVYGPDFWQRMITLQYVRNFSLSPIHKNLLQHFPGFETPRLPCFPISIPFLYLTYTWDFPVLYFT